MDIEEKITLITNAVRLRARKRFQRGVYENPYPEHPQKQPEEMIRGMRIIYQREMDWLTRNLFNG